MDGRISAYPSLQGVLSDNGSLSGNMTIPTSAAQDIYDAEHSFVPSADNQIVINTYQKLLLYDMVIQKIPYAETVNESGGITVFIARNNL